MLVRQHLDMLGERSEDHKLEFSRRAGQDMASSAEPLMLRP